MQGISAASERSAHVLLHEQLLHTQSGGTVVGGIVVPDVVGVSKELNSVGVKLIDVGRVAVDVIVDSLAASNVDGGVAVFCTNVIGVGFDVAVEPFVKLNFD